MIIRELVSASLGMSAIEDLVEKALLSRRQVLPTAVAATSQFILTGNILVKEEPKVSAGVKTMDLDHFVEDCIAANGDSEPQAAVLDVLAKYVRNHQAMLASIGEPREAGMNVFHRSPTLTIFAAIWTPQMNLVPHNHLMWANIGIFTGREDNIMWRRKADRIEACDAKALFEGDAASLPVDVIHSVTNPLLRFTGGIHIYGGDFFNTVRSQWNPETLVEEPSDGAVIRGMFERENKRLGTGKKT
jgi:predicted metal-dependent enzyme (double-stranded beta helix superfamily)